MLIHRHLQSLEYIKADIFSTILKERCFDKERYCCEKWNLIDDFGGRLSKALREFCSDGRLKSTQFRKEKISRAVVMRVFDCFLFVYDLTIDSTLIF
jgi:hypothetical protein